MQKPFNALSGGMRFHYRFHRPTLSNIKRRFLILRLFARRRLVKDIYLVCHVHMPVWLRVRLARATEAFKSFLSVWARAFYFTLFLFYRAYMRLRVLLYELGQRFSSLRMRLRPHLHELKITLSRGRISRAGAIAVVCTLTALILSSTQFAFGLEVIIGGESLGYASSQIDIEDAVATVERRATQYLGHPYTLNLDIDYHFGLIDRNRMIEASALENLLYEKVNDISDVYVLLIDDSIVAANADADVLNSVLTGILAPYKSEDTSLTAEFVQNVKVERRPVSNVYIKTAGEVRNALSAQLAGTKTYEVQAGDTLTSIARSNGLSLDTLSALNPDVKASTLKAGTALRVARAIPLLSVKQTRQLIYTEEIPFVTVSKNNDTIYKGKSTVSVAGVNGTKQITAKVTYVNDEEVEREIVGTQVIREPVTKVIQAGTKTPPPKSPTGTYIRPYWGIVTSNYGYRGREFHTGVDFAGPTGSSIAAADGGTVTFAGWNGNYGRCVIISHGNGIETLYAHCSSLLVKSGQKVAKGETIARLGSTGRSTGPHVHFEVRKNGKHVNPWNYIKK